MNSLPEVVLARKLKCETYDIIMVISKFEKIDEIIAVLKLFQEHKTISKAHVNLELLFVNKDSAYGENVLISLELYKLIKKQPGGREYELTDTGNEALKRKEVPSPEGGLFNIIVSRETLLKSKIIGIKKVESGRNPAQKPDSMPEWLKNELDSATGKTIRLPALNEESCIIDSFEESIFKRDSNNNYRLKLKLEFGKETELYFFNGNDLLIELANKIDSFSVFRDILKNEGKLKIVNENPVLFVRADNLSSQEIMTFTKTYKIMEPEIENYGKFDPVEMRGINIAPLDRKEAIKWAIKLLMETITDYIDETKYKEIAEGVSNRFSDYYDHNIILSYLPTYQNALIKAIAKDDKFINVYWYLLAPSDLKPELV